MPASRTLTILRLSTAALTLCSVMSPLAAQADEFDNTVIYLDEIIVSGGLVPIAKSDTGATVETLSADQLGDGTSSIADALTALPGISFTQNGGIGASSNLRIRGLNAGYVGTRINGIDVTDPSRTQVQYDFGGLTGFGLSSVEVVKGSQSALFGSEAVGGLIDIRTDNAVAPGYNTTLSVSGGSNGTLSGGLSTQYETETGKVYANLSHLKTDGISTRAGDSERDGYETTDLTFGLERDINDTLTVGLTGLYGTSESEFDRSTSDNSGYYLTDQYGLRTFARVTDGIFTNEFSFSLFKSLRSDPLAPTFFTRDFSGTRKSFEYLGTAELSEVSTLSVGVELTEESFSLMNIQWDDSLAETTGSDMNFAAKGEWLYQPSETYDLSVALRYDSHSDFGDHVSGRVAVAWDVAPDWILRSVLSSGFRAPSLYERYSSFGKPDLEEETSRSAEIGLERRFGGDDFAKATLFYTEIDNRIDYDFGTSTYNQVDGTTVSKGLELSGQHHLTDAITLHGNYTYTDAQTAGARDVRIPRHDLVVGLDALLSDRLKGSVQVQHVADVLPSAWAPSDHKVGDYTLVNASVSYDLNDATALSIRIENLLDADYETAGGYNMPGRSAYIGLKASF